ncbi:MAG: 30S ribosomal protein S2, partial [Ilumatobacteraceae bacterium]
EHIAVTEANKLKIPIVAVVDTNVDPDVIQYPIPGNDDAIRANALMSRVIAEAVAEGRYVASRRNPQVAAAPRRSADEEAAFANSQADARRQAAAAQAERDARVAAGGPAAAAPAAAPSPTEAAAAVTSEADADAEITEITETLADDVATPTEAVDEPAGTESAVADTTALDTTDTTDTTVGTEG